MKKWWHMFRKERTPLPAVEIDPLESREALARARADKSSAERDLAEIKVHTRRSIWEREKNHFAPEILKVINSHRGKE